MVRAEELMRSATEVADQRRAVRRRRWRKALLVTGFSLPALLLYGGVVIYPMVTAFSYSFFDWEGLSRGGFAGLHNYKLLFTVYPFDEQLTRAFTHNVVFFIGTFVVQNSVGLGLALLLHANPRGKTFFQVLFSTPYLLSPLIVGYLWTLLLSPIYGPTNVFLRAIGLDSMAHAWLGDPDTALASVIMITAWQWAGFPMLIFGAALAAIPQHFFDAANIDGANRWQMLRHVTLPLLMPSIGIVTILTFVGAFNTFDVVYAVGGSVGAPAGATDMLVLLFYRLAFGGASNAIGVSSALAVMLFLLIFITSIGIERTLRRREVTLS